VTQLDIIIVYKPYAANMNHGGMANTMIANTVAHTAPTATIYSFIVLRFDINAMGVVRTIMFFVFFGFFLHSSDYLFPIISSIHPM